MKHLNKITTYICIAISLLILVDFIVSKQTITETIVSEKTKHQSYYNAGGNSHVSYSVITANESFNCSQSFFETLESQKLININKSLIFNRVNSYQNITTKQKETYSLRYTTGLFVPLAVLLLLILSLTKPNISDILKFVTKLAIVADLIYLLFF
ncbi:hypothetical protein [Aurantibacter sp.]|uniref:hypothetical protein n=1 Tax=Aurantibacter sp. TaxID=2807103 RepID=UPI0035C84B3D